MNLIDDLVAIIATYTTTQSTFSLMLLSPSLALRIYRVYIWQTKAALVTKNMLPDDNVLGKSTVAWYNYYLMRNNIFYGVLVDVRRCPVADTTDRYCISGQEIIPCPTIALGMLGDDYITQTPSLELYVGDRQMSTNLVLRRITKFGSNIFITEDGSIYIIDDDDKTLRVLSKNTDAVDVDWIGSGSFVQLMRDGSLQYINASGQAVHCPGIPHTLIELKYPWGISRCGVLHYMEKNRYFIDSGHGYLSYGNINDISYRIISSTFHVIGFDNKSSPYDIVAASHMNYFIRNDRTVLSTTFVSWNLETKSTYEIVEPTRGVTRRTHMRAFLQYSSRMASIRISGYGTFFTC